MDTTKSPTLAYAGLALLLVGLIAAWMVGMPKYRIYKQDLQGQANLRQQEWEKKIKIEEARAQKESAILYAEAEVARAEGVKKANEIIQQSLGGPEGYLRYLYIQSLTETEKAGGRVIYVPTEAGLPILEAGQR